MSVVKEVLISVTTVVKKKIYEYSLKSHPDKDQWYQIKVFVLKFVMLYNQSSFVIFKHQNYIITSFRRSFIYFEFFGLTQF